MDDKTLIGVPADSMLASRRQATQTRAATSSGPKLLSPPVAEADPVFGAADKLRSRPA